MEEHYLKPSLQPFKSDQVVHAFQYHFPFEGTIYLTDDHGKAHTFDLKPGDWIVKDESGFYEKKTHAEFKPAFSQILPMNMTIVDSKTVCRCGFTGERRG